MEKRVGRLSVGLAAAVMAGACVLIAPRRRDEGLRARWAAMSGYRYAHRGLYDNRTPAPENSLAAFRLARDWGFGSELDVHLTVDGQLVVIHDSRLGRACGVDAVVEDMTFDQLRELRLFGTQERIPSFGEVLAVYEAGEGPCPPLVVELKTRGGNHAELAQKAMALLDAHAVPYCVESFDPYVLWWLRRNRPDVIRGQLSEHFVIDQESDLGLLKKVVASALLFDVASRPDFVAYRYEHRNHPALRLACDALGAWLVYWTVKSPAELAVADDEGAVSIFEGFVPEAAVAEG